MLNNIPNFNILSYLVAVFDLNFNFSNFVNREQSRKIAYVWHRNTGTASAVGRRFSSDGRHEKPPSRAHAVLMSALCLLQIHTQ